jgi:hypothetical protein
MLHAECTNAGFSPLTCGFALPEKWKVGGSTPPLPTTPKPQVSSLACGFAFSGPC